MAELVADCPRCGSAEMTFDVTASHRLKRVDYRWMQWHEVFSICRRCSRTTTFVIHDRHDVNWEKVQEIGVMKLVGALNRWVGLDGYVSLKDRDPVAPPEHLPEEIKNAFTEGATCQAAQCYNAAGTMFRLCVDLATRALVPPAEPAVPGLNNKTRRDLGLRLPWLFENKLLPESLHDLAACIKEDGNDGAHAGTLKKEDVEDLLDFTAAVLTRLYTEPERLRLAKERRDTRRVQPTR
jgi:hypothetical protein